MANRSVIVRLEAQVGGYVAGFGKAATATEDVVKKTAQAKKSITENKQAMQEAGKAYLGFGAITVAGLGAAAKAAMDWESAWAGVTKTVDGTPEQMAELQDELRGLAKVLPATHEEIAGVAEAAGQLGVAREDVASFTKTMIDLAETTNLSADEAATGIAQFMNVMGTAGTEVDNLGSALVALGNDGASTEAEIMAMAQRLSGVGKLIGASESDVLAMANAMASVGIEAQLGGGVMSRVMQRMYADVMEGGEGLQALADVAGVSAKDFATAFENDPIRATDLMVKGLNGVKESGGNVVQTMKDIGIKGTEETSVLLRLAGAGDLLTDSLDLGAVAWRENTALADEAAKRYETTEAKVQMAWNSIKDAAIDAGAAILPVIQGVAETVGGLASAFGDLPAPVQGAITIFAGIAGGASLLAGALLTTIPRIVETREAFRTLRGSGSQIPGVVGKVTKAVGGLAAGYAAAATAAALLASAQAEGRTKTSVEGFNNALAGMAENGAAAKAAMNGMFDGVLNPDALSGGVGAVNDLEGALNRVFNTHTMDNVHDFFGTVLGQNATTGVNITKDAIGDLDKSIASLASSGSVKDAAAAFDEVRRVAEAQEIPISELVTLFPEYQDVIRSAATENGKTQLSQEELIAAMEGTGSAALKASDGAAVLEQAIAETGVSVEGVVGDMDKFLEQLFALGVLTRDVRGANREFEEAIDSLSETIEKNGTTLDTGTEKGRANEAAFDAIAVAGQRATEALAGNGASNEELQESMSNTYDSLIDAAGQLGITGEEADTMARKVMGIPDDVKVETWISDAIERGAERSKTAVENIPGYKEVTVNYVLKQTGVSPDGVPAGGFINSFPGKATGGAINGPGSGTSDTAGLFALSNGEHVLTASEVQAMGGQSSVYRFRQQLKSGVRGYAEGGAVGTMYAPPPAITISAGSGGGMNLGGVVINGATDADAVRRAVVDEIQWKFQQNGVRLG